MCGLWLMNAGCRMFGAQWLLLVVGCWAMDVGCGMQSHCPRASQVQGQRRLTEGMLEREQCAGQCWRRGRERHSRINSGRGHVGGVIRTRSVPETMQSILGRHCARYTLISHIGTPRPSCCLTAGPIDVAATTILDACVIYLELPPQIISNMITVLRFRTRRSQPVWLDRCFRWRRTRRSGRPPPWLPPAPRRPASGLRADGSVACARQSFDAITSIQHAVIATPRTAVAAQGASWSGRGGREPRVPPAVAVARRGGHSAACVTRRGARGSHSSARAAQRGASGSHRLA